MTDILNYSQDSGTVDYLQKYRVQFFNQIFPQWFETWNKQLFALAALRAGAFYQRPQTLYCVK